MSAPDALAVSWPEQSMLDRLQYCRLMLSVHGMLTEAEKRKVEARIAKWARGLKP